jgi:uncharacterized membrane protein
VTAVGSSTVETDAATQQRPRPGRADAATCVALVAVVLTGAIFGFFYAWVCSTMWGLDDTDPRVAVEAMQAMNASVRNAVFFPAFFLTPFTLGLVAVLLRRGGRQRGAFWFGLAAATYFFGGLVVTMVVNVPMNEDLALHTDALTEAEAARIWEDYSRPWQLWNIARTVASGTALVFAANGLRFLSIAHRADGLPT